MTKIPEAGSLESFAADWEALGARGNPQPTYDELRERYSEPHRHYHTWEQHIAPGETDMNVVLIPHFNQTKAVHTRMAWRFHDAIQVPEIQDKRNVRDSADLLIRKLISARVGRMEVRAMASLVLATNYEYFPTTEWERIIVDTDLAIFGKPEDAFNKYEQGIEQEYDWVEPKRFVDGRLDIMQGFRRREDGLYQTADFRERFGAQSKINLDRSIAQLKARQAP